VITGPVQDKAATFACEQLNERGFDDELTGVATGTHPYPGLTFKMANAPKPLRPAAVTLGEDQDYVYQQLLGYSAEEYGRLLASEQVETERPATPYCFGQCRAIQPCSVSAFAQSSADLRASGSSDLRSCCQPSSRRPPPPLRER